MPDDQLGHRAQQRLSGVVRLARLLVARVPLFAPPGRTTPVSAVPAVSSPVPLAPSLALAFLSLRARRWVLGLTVFLRGLVLLRLAPRGSHQTGKGRRNGPHYLGVLSPATSAISASALPAMVLGNPQCSYGGLKHRTTSRDVRSRVLEVLLAVAAGSRVGEAQTLASRHGFGLQIPDVWMGQAMMLFDSRPLHGQLLSANCAMRAKAADEVRLAQYLFPAGACYGTVLRLLYKRNI